jgi:hypothetical protein
VGVAGEQAAPKLVLALQHADGRLHHLGRLGVSCVLRSRRGECVLWLAKARLAVSACGRQVLGEVTTCLC